MKIKKFKEFLKENYTSESYIRLVFTEIFYGARSLNYERQLEKYFPIEFGDINAAWKLAKTLDNNTPLKQNYDIDGESTNNNLLLHMLNIYFGSDSKDEIYDFIHNHEIKIKNYDDINDKSLFGSFYLKFENY